MQKTTIFIHILDTDKTLPSVSQCFIDHLKIAEYLFPEMNYSLTRSIQKETMDLKKLNYLVLPPSLTIDTPTSTEIKLLENVNKTGTIIACCGGVTKLAQTGLLNNKFITTHWNFLTYLQENFPSIKYKTHKPIVKDKNIVTAGGVLSYLDVICWIIKKEYGKTKARKFNEFIQGPGIREYQTPSTKVASIKYKEIFDVFDKEEIQNINLNFVSAVYAMSPRSFQRYLTSKYQTNFRTIFNEYRLLMAEKLLLKRKPVKEVAYLVGFEDEMSFRRFFKKEKLIPISKYIELKSLI